MPPRRNTGSGAEGVRNALQSAPRWRRRHRGVWVTEGAAPEPGSLDAACGEERTQASVLALVAWSAVIVTLVFALA